MRTRRRLGLAVAATVGAVAALGWSTSILLAFHSDVAERPVPLVAAREIARDDVRE